MCTGGYISNTGGGKGTLYQDFLFLVILTSVLLLFVLF